MLSSVIKFCYFRLDGDMMLIKVRIGLVNLDD
jgi:hypothetical protein